MKKEEKLNSHKKRQSTNARDEMTLMLEVPDNNFDADIIKMLQKIRTNIPRLNRKKISENK